MYSLVITALALSHSGISTLPTSFLPKSLRREFSKSFQARSAGLDIQAAEMRFDELGKMVEGAQDVPEFLCCGIEEIAQLENSPVSERAAVTKHLAFIFWPGRTISDTGFLLLLDRLVVALKAGLIGAVLTEAEAALSLHLALGYDLRNQSSLHRNTYEANRSCLKGIYGKLDCNDQRDLIALLYAGIIFELSKTASDRKQFDATDVAFSKVKYGKFRAFSISVRGFEVRCIDMGPRCGRPVVLHHASRVPFIDPRHIKRLYINNIRLLMLLRPGCLGGGSAPKTVQEQTLIMRDAARLLAALASPINGISVTGHANGCNYALSSTEKLDGLNSMILFFPASERSGRNTAFGGLLRTVSSLTKSGDFLVSAYVHSYTKLLKNDRVFEMVARHLRDDHSTDSQKILEELSCPDKRSFFRQSCAESAPSIILDMKLGLEQTICLNEGSNFKRHVILGQNDKRDLKGFNGFAIHRLNDVTEYACSSAWTQMIDTIGDFI